MATHSDPERFHAESVEARRAWLEANDDRTDGCLRKPASGWSRPNKERIERLEREGREGRILAAGRQAVGIAKDKHSWLLLDDVENLVVPADLALAFEGYPGAPENWNALPKSARAKRAAKAAETASRGEGANQRPRA